MGDIISGETRGRKKNVIVPSDAVTGMKKIETDIATAEELYGDGEPYNIDRLITVAKAKASMAVEQIIDVGKICLRIKAHESYGDFVTSVERMEINSGFAWLCMQTVLKFGDDPEISPVKFLGIRKTKALVAFDKTVLEKYVNGGDLLTIPHDDVEKMPARELEAEVRKLREQIKADKEAAEKRLKAVESVVKSKEEKLTALELEAAHKVPPSKEQIAQNELERFSMDFFQPINLLNKAFADAIYTLDRVMQIPNITKAQLDTFVQKYAEDVKLLGGLYTGFEETVDNLFPRAE